MQNKSGRGNCGASGVFMGDDYKSDGKIVRLNKE